MVFKNIIQREFEVMSIWLLIIIYLLSIFLLRYLVAFVLYPIDEIDFKGFIYYNILINYTLFFVKTIIISLVFLLSFFLFLEKNPSYKLTIKAIVIAQFAYLLKYLFKIVNVWFINPEKSRDDFMNLYEFTASSILKIESGSSLLKSFINKFSIYDLIYFIFLFIIFKYCIVETREYANKIVFGVYLSLFIVINLIISLITTAYIG